MASFLLPAAASLGAPLLSSLFGGRNDPTERLRQQAMALFTPQNVGNYTNQFYQQFLSSPAFAQMQANAAARQNSLQGNLAASLGARGLSTSGIGAIAPQLASTSAGREITGYRAQGYQNAQQQAMAALQQRLQALTGLGVPRNLPAELFGGGLDAFSKFLLQRYLQPGQNSSLPQNAMNSVLSGQGWSPNPMATR